jgi:HK97 gp10 family phage protein
MAADNGWSTAQVLGLKELHVALKELPDRIARNVLRGSVSAGAAVIRAEMKARAPVSTGPVSQGHPPPGALKKAVYQKQIRELSSLLNQTFYVGVRHGKKEQKRGKNKDVNLDAYYFRFVEFGTSKMAARPFMRPAFEAKKNAAVEAMKSYMSERILKEVAKLTVFGVRL